MNTVIDLLVNNWFAFVCVGVIARVINNAIPEDDHPNIVASLRSLSRFALSVPIALAAGIPLAFLGLVLGTMGLLLVFLVLTVALLFWSGAPLLRIAFPSAAIWGNRANDASTKTEGQV